MNTMPLPELVEALKEKAGSSNDIVLALTLNILANRLNGAYDEGRAKTIEACLAAVLKAGVKHENVAHDAYTNGRMAQHSADIAAIKGVGDE